MTCQAVSCTVTPAGEKAKRGSVWPRCCAIPAGITLIDLRTMHDQLVTEIARHTAHYFRFSGIDSKRVEVSPSACCKRRGTRAVL
jgi:hypothetical protein